MGTSGPDEQSNIKAMGEFYLARVADISIVFLFTICLLGRRSLFFEGWLSNHHVSGVIPMAAAALSKCLEQILQFT